MTGVNFRFDWKSNQYQLAGGTPAELTGADACQAWIENALHIRRGRLEIMPDTYGTSAQDLIGRRLPRGYRIAEIEREVRECAALCPGIESVSGFKVDGDVISFSMRCVDGSASALPGFPDPPAPSYGEDRIVNIYIDGDNLIVLSEGAQAGYTQIHDVSMSPDGWLSVNLADVGDDTVTAYREGDTLVFEEA